MAASCDTEPAAALAQPAAAYGVGLLDASSKPRALRSPADWTPATASHILNGDARGFCDPIATSAFVSGIAPALRGGAIAIGLNLVKAIVYELTAPRSLTMREVELDADRLEDRQILAATEFSAISPGTELAAWRGDPPLRPSRVYPRVVGYCNVARVLAVGAGVSDVAVGDCILTHQSHRSHFVCERSQVLLALAELDVESRRKLATTYLYHLGYMALLSGGYVPGHTVAVIGMGALGYTTATLACAFGAAPIVLSNRAREDLCALPQHVHVHSTRALASESPPDLGGEVDLVVNTSNAWSDHLLALKIARKGGVIVLLGFPGRGDPTPAFNPLDSQYVYDKQLTIRQAGHVTEGDLPAIDVRFTLQRNVAYLWSLLRRGALDPSALIAHRTPWRDLPATYQRLESRTTRSLSALLEW